MITTHITLRKTTLVFLIFLCSQFVFGQQITLLDATTKKGIYNVTVTFQSTNQSKLSNHDGVVDLSDIAPEEILIISHPYFVEVTLLGQYVLSGNRDIVLQEKIIQINEVVISANKWEQNQQEVPNEITTISAKEIALRNPQTAADMMQQTGQIFVQKSQMGGGSPMIRGFSANSILIMMDGIRINNAIYRSGNLQNIIMLDPNLLASSEVIFGPGSTVYGSDALGGVMDFHTLKPQYNDSKSKEISGLSMIRGSSANQEKTGHLNFNINNNKWNNIFGITFSSFDDLRAGNNRPSQYPDFGKRPNYIERIDGVDQVVANPDPNKQIHSGYSQYNIMNKLSHRLSDKSELTYMFYYTSSSNIPRYDRLIQKNDQGNLKYATWQYGPQNFLLNALTFSNYHSNALYDGLKIVVSAQSIEESRIDRTVNSLNLRTRTENVKTYAINVDIDKKIDASQELFYGLEFLINDVASSAISKQIDTDQISPEATRYPDGGSTYRAASAYASYKNIVNHWMVMTAGLRYTRVYLNAVFTDKSFYNFPYDELTLNNDALSGTLGMVAHPLPSLKWSTLFSTGFRSPNVDDVGKVFDSTPGHVVVPNEDLRAEYTYNMETGINWKIKDKITLDGTIYYTEMKDAMVRRPYLFDGQPTIIYDGEESDVSALVNVGEAYIWGWSLGVSAKLTTQLTLSSRVNNNDGKDRTENIPLRHTNPLFGHIGLAHQKNKLYLELYSDFQAKRSWDELAPSEQEKTHLYTPDGALAWYTINIRSGYEFNKAISMTAALENILDQHYRPYSSGISASGFNAVVSARVRF